MVKTDKRQVIFQKNNKTKFSRQSKKFAPRGHVLHAESCDNVMSTATWFWERTERHSEGKRKREKDADKNITEIWQGNHIWSFFVENLNCKYKTIEIKQNKRELVIYFYKQCIFLKKDICPIKSCRTVPTCITVNWLLPNNIQSHIH